MKKRIFSLSAIFFLMCFFTLSIHSDQTPVKSKLRPLDPNNELISSGTNNEFITKNKYQWNPTIHFNIQDENPTSLVAKHYYSRLLGGSMDEEAYSIAVDKEGNVYVTGTTMSKDFPTTKGAFDRSHNERKSAHTRGDIFVTKINPNGKIVYSTFLGGETGDIAYSIAVDSEGCAYVTGMTVSSDFPVTRSAINKIYNSGSLSGGGDAFVAKLSSDGSSLLYSTFLGGEGNDAGFSIALDAENNIYVTGMTNSWNFPTTKGALKEKLDYGSTNGFITKISPDGGKLIYSTFLGGSSYDLCISLTVDKELCVYVTGGAASSDFPTTENAFDKSIGGNSDAFISKLSPDGSTLIYSTFIGGSEGEDGISIVVDDEGYIYLTGVTQSPDFPTTENVWSRNLKGNADIFIAKINQDGSKLIYSTLLGGSTKNPNIDLGEAPFSIAIDMKGCAYITGYTSSPDFPIIPKSSSSKILENSREAFILILSPDGSDILYSQLLEGSWSDSSGFTAPISIGHCIKLLEKEKENLTEVYITGDTNWDGMLATGEYKRRKEPAEYDAFVQKYIFSDKPERKPIIIILTIGNKEALIDEEKYILDTPPIIMNGRTLVPVRFIAEAFGATVEWIPKSQEVVIHYGWFMDGIDIYLRIGEKEATIHIYEGDLIDEKIIDLDTPPIIRGGRTLVPVRFIAEAFGATVEWIPNERKVRITF